MYDTWDCENHQWYQDRVLLCRKLGEKNAFNKQEVYGSRYVPAINGGRNIIDCEGLFLLEYKVIEISSPSQVVEHFNFKHPQVTSQRYGRIYISDDKEYMLEKLVNHEMYLFKKQLNKDFATSKTVTWAPMKRIINHSIDISEFSYYNYLFSPNLHLYFDSDNSGSCYTIRSTIDQSCYLQIPVGILNTKFDKPREIVKKFTWVSDSRFKVINSDGVEQFFEITAEKTLQSLGSCSVPMMLQSRYEVDSKYSKNFFFKRNHYYHQNDSISPMEMLLQKVQRYYSRYYVHGEREPEKLYNALFDIDYKSGSERNQMIVQMSFSYYHWKLAETLSNSGSSFKVTNLTDNEIQLLALNIFPGGKTVNHYIAKEIPHIKNLYRMARDVEIIERVPLEIPFIRDFKGKSPLHICYEAEAYQSFTAFLEVIKYDEFDLHARAICDLYPLALKQEIPGFDEYLSCRMLQTKALKKIKRGVLVDQYLSNQPVVSAAQWPDDNHLRKILLQEQSENDIERDLKVSIIDLPMIHAFKQPYSKDFYYWLGKVENLDLFGNVAVRAIIDERWPVIQYYTFLFLLIPFVFYLGIFLAFSNVFNYQIISTPEDQQIEYILVIILYVFSVYFLLNEGYQIINQGVDYFLTFWNYSDLCSPVFIIVVISYELRLIHDNTYVKPAGVVTLHSIACLLMWLKFFYFLRIFRHTGYFIRMLSDVIYDIRLFIVVISIVFLGFGDAFYRLSQYTSPDSAWLGNYALGTAYAFLMSIGSNDPSAFDANVQTGACWVLFVFSIALTNIVMLNLLVAIISESFAKINDSKYNANYQERAKLISENNYLVPSWVKKAQNVEGHYLIIGEDGVLNEDAGTADEDSKEADGTPKIKDPFKTNPQLIKLQEDYETKSQKFEDYHKKLVQQNIDDLTTKALYATLADQVIKELAMMKIEEAKAGAAKK